METLNIPVIPWLLSSHSININIHENMSYPPPPQPTIPVNDPRLIVDAPPPYSRQQPIQSFAGSIRILNVEENETVHQRIILVSGRAGPEGVIFESRITITGPNFPSLTWPVVDSHFKALVHLNPGLNIIMLTFHPPDGTAPLISNFRINYVPLLQNPPLHLAILCSMDSEHKFDTPPEKSDQNTLSIAIEKFRAAAYMWQAFTAEQMYRNGFGRRTFRLAEQWELDTISSNDPQPTFRTTAHIHIIHYSTLNEIQDPKIAQQNPQKDESQRSLFSIFLDALKQYGPPFDKPCIVAGLILDTHWDPRISLVRGHAAVGGGAGHIRLGIFGSHLLHAWPRSLEGIEDAFMNTTPTDTRYIANDANESGQWWRAANIGMGAHLHEVGHALYLSHTPTGIMARGYNNWNRTFMVKEPGLKGPIEGTARDEVGSHWHRVDVVRLRFHHALWKPQDAPIVQRPVAPSFMVLEDGLVVFCPVGLIMLEFWVDERYVSHQEFLDHHPTEVPLNVIEISRTANIRPGQKLELVATALSQETDSIKDVAAFLSDSFVQLPDLGRCIRGIRTGQRSSGVSTDYQTIFAHPQHRQPHLRFPSLHNPNQQHYITKIRIHSGYALDGLVFFWSNGSESLFGRRGGSASDFNIEPGEKIYKFNLRSGAWIDAIEIVTDRNRSSGWFGGSGGGLIEMKPPRGYELVGLFGSGGDWLNEFGVLYRRIT